MSRPAYIVSFRDPQVQKVPRPQRIFWTLKQMTDHLEAMSRDCEMQVRVEGIDRDIPVLCDKRGMEYYAHVCIRP